MVRLARRAEGHAVGRLGWLRAAVLGANDGILSEDDRRVIAATALCDKGETVMIQFIAPPPGNYPFLCSTHPEDMRGTLHVTK